MKADFSLLATFFTRNKAVIGGGGNVTTIHWETKIKGTGLSQRQANFRFHSVNFAEMSGGFIIFTSYNFNLSKKL